ncbi:MAG: hypothetical protein HND48_18875 [Chloroflexi bacterium]|nr:hypothetical protein [Chloroflexota bacterium]
MGRIVTLTANTTIDQTLVIPRYASGTTIRAKRSVVSIGGKPTDVSYILGEMGVGSLAPGSPPTPPACAPSRSSSRAVSRSTSSRSTARRA